MPKFKKGDVVANKYNDEEPNYVVLNGDAEYGDFTVMVLGVMPYIDNKAPDDIVPTKQKPWVVARKNIDGYDAIGLAKGKKKIISIGCRTFLKPTDAKRHWANDERGTHWNDEIGINPERVKKNNRRLKATLKFFDKLETM